MNDSNNRFQGTLHKVSGPLNRDVGATMRIEPINPKNPVVGDTATIRPAPSLLETGGTARNQMNSPNKALHHYGAQSAPRVNADVGSGKIIWATARIMDLPH